jgi:hypothetical protein
MPKSIRHTHEARQAAMNAVPVAPKTYEYEVLDVQHRPHLTGLDVYYKDGKQTVRLTEKQAQFYIDNGAMAKITPPEENPT